MWPRGLRAAGGKQLILGSAKQRDQYSRPFSSIQILFQSPAAVEDVSKSLCAVEHPVAQTASSSQLSYQSNPVGIINHFSDSSSSPGSPGSSGHDEYFANKSTKNIAVKLLRRCLPVMPHFLSSAGERGWLHHLSSGAFKVENHAQKTGKNSLCLYQLPGHRAFASKAAQVRGQNRKTPPKLRTSSGASQTLPSEKSSDPTFEDCLRKFAPMIDSLGSKRDMVASEEEFEKMLETNTRSAGQLLAFLDSIQPQARGYPRTGSYALDFFLVDGEVIRKVQLNFRTTGGDCKKQVREDFSRFFKGKICPFVGRPSMHVKVWVYLALEFKA